MNNEFNLEERYGLVFVGKRRYYYQDLTQRDHSLECSAPLSLQIGSKSFIQTSWKQLLIDVSKEYLKEQPDKRDVLIDFVAPWNGKHPYFDQPSKWTVEVGKDIHLLCNQTAIHACWLLREMLLIFGVDLKKCEFVIHRPPHAEPIECQKYFESKTRNSFKFYLTKLLKKSDDYADKVLGNIDKLNKILPKVSLSYDNFYLFDENLTFTNYRLKFIEYLEEKMFMDPKSIQAAEKLLSILGEFYKTIY